MTSQRPLLACAALLLSVGARAANVSANPDTAPTTNPSTFGPAMPGWDGCKWNDPKHLTPKYVVGRIVSRFPHTPNGLKQAEPLIAQYFPGSKVIDDTSDDKIDIPCVGVIDMVVAADGPDVGKSWAWQVVTDKCKSCPDKKDHCDGPEVSRSSRCGGNDPRAGSDLGDQLGKIGTPPPGTPPPHTGGGENPPPCAMPNGRAVAQWVRDQPGMDIPFRKTCRNGTDWTYMEALIDKLNEQGNTNRWGYWCRRGNCNDPSHDVLAYYCGTGNPTDGSPNAAGVDFIGASCYNPEDWDKENPSVTWQTPFGSGGQPAWTSRHP